LGTAGRIYRVNSIRRVIWEGQWSRRDLVLFEGSWIGAGVKVLCSYTYIYDGSCPVHIRSSAIEYVPHIL
jgi:hypothetical protein